MTRVGIFGATGYGGIELIRLLLQHPAAKVTYIAGHTTIGQRLDQVYPHLRGLCELIVEEPDAEKAGDETDVLCFALEAGKGTELVKQALQAGKRVLDFSADYRLKSALAYQEFYGEHPAPELLDEAVYGLPELHREELRGTRLAAVPGCHATAAILALAPLVKRGLVEPGSICIDSKTGISGAGRTRISLLNHYPEADENLVPYSLPDHRHRPEIEQELGLLGGGETRLTFVPSRVPMVRGILSIAFGSAARELTTPQVLEAYREFYKGEPFVRVLPAGELPTTKQVAGSNYADVTAISDRRAGRIIGLCALDNLVKGLAGAAVQCLNLMCGYEETTGLKFAGVWP